MNPEERLIRLLFLSGIPDDLVPLAQYLLEEITISRREMRDLEEYRQDVSSAEGKELLELLQPEIERSLIAAGADPEELEEEMLEADETDINGDIDFQIEHHRQRVEKCHELFDQLDEGKFEGCLAYFEEKMAYRREIKQKLLDALPKFKVSPRIREREQAHERTIKSFIALLKNKLKPAPST